VLKDALKRVVGRPGRLLVRRLRTRRWPITKAYRQYLRGMRALEIGGPSDVLGFAGAFPIYSCLGAIHNCNYSDRTIWQSEAVKYSQAFVWDATALGAESGSYDCVIASHCLEHVANPFKALIEWKRVLRSDGVLLLLLPHRDFTFDWRRPVTTLAPCEKTLSWERRRQTSHIWPRCLRCTTHRVMRVRVRPNISGSGA
jgi:hypothetical protein